MRGLQIFSPNLSFTSFLQQNTLRVFTALGLCKFFQKWIFGGQLKFMKSIISLLLYMSWSGDILVKVQSEF